MADFKKVKHKLKTLFAKNVHSAHHNITTLAMTSSMDHVLPLNPEQIDVLTGTYFYIYYYGTSNTWKMIVIT